MAEIKKIKVRDAVTVYNALRMTNASRLPDIDKADLFAIIRAIRSLKGIAEAQADFERDAAERLRPANFNDIMARRERYNDLAPEQQREVVEALRDYDRAFAECVRPEQEKEVEAEIDPLSEAAIAAVAKASDDMRMEVLILISEVCGGK